MAVLGTAELGAVNTQDPDVAWKEHEHDLGLTREEFATYLKGADSAHLLHIHKPRALSEPIPLSHLRASAEAFKPPQSFRYITPQDPLPLLTAASTTTRSSIA
jgi:predicted transcriptional regulator